MDQNSIIKSYKRVSSFYDLTFGQVFRPGQKAIIKKMDCIDSDNVLEIGIGTGSSLQYYPKETKVVGIDISPDMLEVAKKRIVKDKIHNKHILLMNGERLSFPDNSFDKVVGMYVVSVTQNPQVLVEEMKRVCKKIGYMQEGPYWYFQDYPMEQQIWFFNTLMEMDVIFAHNRADVEYFKGLTQKEHVYQNRSLMITDEIK